jgi:hypothetical protein
MYCRNVIFKLKGKSAVEFTRILEEEIIPSLRGQRGFEDEISVIVPERNEAVAISLWEEIDDAEIYHQKTFPSVVKILSKVNRRRSQCGNLCDWKLHFSRGRCQRGQADGPAGAEGEVTMLWIAILQCRRFS